LRWLFVLWVLACVPQQARADADEDARVLFVAGVEASRAERWQDARDSFKRSVELVPKPSTLINLAVVELKLGLAREALLTLEAFERLASPAEHQAMLERARALKRAAQAELKGSTETGAALRELQDVTLLEGEAAALFEAGRQAYWSGRYAQALEYFEGAYELSKRPELLYDIGAAADRLRDDERALTALEAFLAESPSSPLSSAVRARVEVLRRVVAEKKARVVTDDPRPTPAQTLPPPRAPEPVERWPAVRPWVFMGTGVALAGSAVGMSFYYRSRVKARDRCGEDGAGCSNTSSLDRQERTGLASVISLASLGAGFFATGAILGAKEWRQNVGASVSREGAMLELRGRF
jgi:hypothetical protein